ncbi:MAG: DUF4178 domain-containing protein [Erysipelotrichia bacterium]|nr:DUF4178 domain-containing protein [Erysipelotrichia bacterium]
MANATTTKPALRSLKCTQCGGSIGLRGGHNVRSIVCQYCGTCLDTKDNFKVLHQFLNQKRPFMPLKIGASGKLKGILFTVIGVIQYDEKEDGMTYRWLEYLLFSLTHGYVWLCYEDGHWVMTYEVKDLPETDVQLISPRKTAFTVRNKKFKVFESSGAQISYVEGELTWQAKQNEKIRYLDAVCPPYMYSIESRGTEQEYFWGEYLTAETIKEAFKIETPDPTGVFPCQPLAASPIFATFSKVSAVTAIAALVLYFFITSSGSPIIRQNLGAATYTDGAASKEFKAGPDDGLYRITVHTPSLKNAWSFFDLKVVDKNEDTQYFTMPADLSFYEGYEGGEYWSEGTTEVTSYFKMPEAGEFKLNVEAEGGTAETPQPNFSMSTVQVEIRKGVRLGHYTLSWFFICLLLAAPYVIQAMRFENARWNDGDDEDDD